MAEPLSAPPVLPTWTPAWASQLAELCFSGTTSVFVLHGNTNDLMPRGETPEDGYGTIADMLAEQLFGKWDVLLHYDLGRGLRAFAGRNEKRLQKMVAQANEKITDLSTVKNDPGVVLALLDRFVRNNIVAAVGGRPLIRCVDIGAGGGSVDAHKLITPGGTLAVH